MSRSAITLLNKHGKELARAAYKLHLEDGEGCSTIGTYLGLQWTTADGLINAGRELEMKKTQPLPPCFQ